MRWRTARRRSTASSIRRSASPAWMLDHDIRSYEMIARVFDGKPEGLTRDDVLDNVTLYWLTNTAISSARLYWDTTHNLPPAASSTCAASSSRSPSAPFRTRSTRRRGAGRRRPIRTSSTTTARQGRSFRGVGTAGALRAELRAAFRSLRQSM